MNEARFVIVGGGMVAGYAAKQLVELGLTPGELAILSADTSVPYERPPLSKGFLAGKDTEDSIWKQFFSPQMSRFFEAYYEARGIRFVKKATVKELRGDGVVNSATLGDGHTIACEMVVAGIGVRPATEMLSNSGIEVADGV